MAAILGRQIGVQVCDILGLDPAKVRSIVIDLTLDDIAITVAEQYLELDEAGAFVEVLRQHRFILAPDGEGQRGRRSAV